MQGLEAEVDVGRDGSALERSVARDGSAVVVEPGPPLLILPLRTRADAWPPGTVDLRGRAW